MPRAAVQDSFELRRIVALARRTWTLERAQDIARDLTDALRAPGGTMQLRPIQAIALAEIGLMRGALLPMPVGSGKTLVTMLAARMLPVERPLLLVPAALRERTERELRTLRAHWVLPPFVRVESYETLSQVKAADFLETYRPDLIIADEAHKLKNPSAACTRRVARYLKAHRKACAFVALSGSLVKRSIGDVAHVASWALADFSPLPADWSVLQEWKCALDVNVSGERKMDPGHLTRLCGPGEEVRHGFARRVRETPGVICAAGPDVDVPLRVRSRVLDAPAEITDAFETLRMKWERPDGYAFADGMQVWRCARELASGFFYRYEPTPPPEWMAARREWAALCRRALATNRRNIDTEKQLVLAVREGYYPELAQPLEEWKAIEPTFELRTVPVWLSDYVTAYARAWEGPGIIWVWSQALGRRLEAQGFRYFAAEGFDAGGTFIEQGPTNATIVASIASCKEGMNLQGWRRHLALDVPRNGLEWEQFLGRSHRPGQTHPVAVDVLFGCHEDVRAFWRSTEDASFASTLWGQVNKLGIADLEEVEGTIDGLDRDGPQWVAP